MRAVQTATAPAVKGREAKASAATGPEVDEAVIATTIAPGG